MNLVHEGVLDPNEPDFRDEKREEEEALLERETLADIVAAMHNDAELYHAAWLNDPNENPEADDVSNLLSYYARRIEAAWKRERVEVRMTASTTILKERVPVAVGNAAAMREALKTIHDKANSLDEECGVDPVEIRDIARAALSAPARNCDLYATATEALKAQDVAFNEDNFKNGECRLGCPGCDDGLIDCKILWLFAPAAERKGEVDGR